MALVIGLCVFLIMGRICSDADTIEHLVRNAINIHMLNFSFLKCVYCIVHILVGVLVTIVETTINKNCADAIVKMGHH